MKYLYILFISFILASCTSWWNRNIQETLNGTSSWDIIVKTGNNTKFDKEKEKKKDFNELEVNIVEQENLDREKYEENLKNLNLSSCDKYKWWFKQECQLNIIFSKYNTKWCSLAKEKWDDKLYQKCLEIENWIKEYEKIRKWEYYYNTYKK